MAKRSKFLAALAVIVLESAAIAQPVNGGQPRTVAQIEAERASLRAREAELERELALAQLEEDRRFVQEYAANRERALAAQARIDAAEGRSPTGPTAPIVAQETRTVTERTAPDGTTTRETIVETDYTQQGLRSNPTGLQEFGGIEFGIGIAFSYDLGSNDRIREASLVNDLVRVTHRENVRARIILESHYFFTPTGRNGAGKSLFGLRNTSREHNWGIGPFVALQPGTDNVIDAIGGGLMVGFRRPDTESQSFNLGIGLLFDLNTRILGEGITANQPLPAGESEIRYLTQEQSGLLVVSSYTF